MKAKKNIALALLSLLNYSAYSQCLQNAHFEQYCGTTINSCPTFDNTNCVPNWSRSHGTPQIITPGPQSINNYAYMWSRYIGLGVNGEGMFANFNFVANNTYKIKIKLSATTPATGQIFLYAANNMVPNQLTVECGDPIPNVTSKELITYIEEANQGWKEYTISFTPDSNYTQLWVYPYTSSTSQFDLSVDYIYLCLDECENTIYYNIGEVPTGATNAKYIYAGSSAGTGGSGTVTVSSTGVTDLIATTEIQLKPEFQALVTTGVFTAKIQACVPNFRAENNSNTNMHINPRHPDTYIDSIYMARAKKLPSNSKPELIVFPNPAYSKLSVNLINSSEKIENIQVLNLTGSVIQQYNKFIRTKTELHLELNISTIPNGIYFIRITRKSGNIIKKFIKTS